MSNTSQRGCEIAWNTSQNLFKLFLCDIGLLASQMSSTVRLEFLQGEPSANWGSILENAVAQELTAHGIKLRYFDKAKYGEVDFLLSTPQGVLPVKTSHIEPSPISWMSANGRWTEPLSSAKKTCASPKGSHTCPGTLSCSCMKSGDPTALGRSLRLRPSVAEASACDRHEG